MADNKKNAVDWFRAKARSAASYRKNIVGNTERHRNSVAIGKMYFFYYDPKTKAKLPIYDRFPLVFPIERYSDGFLGLNLHYLSGRERKAFLGKLMEYKTSKTLTPRTKLELSYDLIINSKKLANPARPCIKRYLTSQMRSRFVEITADEWEKVIDLPVESFVTKS